MLQGEHDLMSLITYMIRMACNIDNMDDIDTMNDIDTLDDIKTMYDIVIMVDIDNMVVINTINDIKIGHDHQFNNGRKLKEKISTVKLY